MDWRRWFRHLVTSRRDLRRAFPPATLDAIERTIAESEREHGGEIRFAVEAALEPHEVRAGKTPRARALEVFAGLGVWDTEANNGILVYVLVADRDVEIVADRGYNRRVSPEEWQEICATMNGMFRDGRFEAGAIDGVRRVGATIARHFPPHPERRDENELPDRPALL